MFLINILFNYLFTHYTLQVSNILGCSLRTYFLVFFLHIFGYYLSCCVLLLLEVFFFSYIYIIAFSYLRLNFFFVCIVYLFFGFDASFFLLQFDFFNEDFFFCNFFSFIVVATYVTDDSGVMSINYTECFKKVLPNMIRLENTIFTYFRK